MFLILRTGFHLAYPGHRQQVLAGACPNTKILGLDWFSVGILATGLPLALQTLGPWVAINVVFLVGVFVVPRFQPERQAMGTKLAALILGSLVFVYANYGGLLPIGPAPAAVVGPVATLVLSDATVDSMMRVINSVSVGPLVIALFGVTMNHLLTRPEVQDIPLLHHSLPQKDPDRVVVVSAALGTVFYLLVVAVATGELVLVP